jgi:hypothetical protein
MTRSTEQSGGIMRRVLVAIVGLALMPVVTSARASVDGALKEERVADEDRAAGSASLSVQAAFASARLVDDDTAAVAQTRPVVPPSQAQPVGPPLPDPSLPRRRGSMVGYIDDAVVGSKIRIRFESGLHDHTPDRAEFFYAKCGCYADGSLKGTAGYDPAAPGPRPNAVADLNFQQLYVQGEYAISSRVSAFAELPTRWLQPKAFLNAGAGFASQAGISDLRAGVKLAVVADSRQAVTVQVQMFLPTGQALNGLGTDHATVQPELLLYHQVSDRVAVESMIGDWHPFGGSAGVPTSVGGKFSGDVFFYGIGPSYEVYRQGPVRFAPMVELVGWRVISGYQTAATPSPDASGTNIVNLKIGARTSWSRESSFYVGYGHALTTATWYDDIVRFEYRYSF